MFEIKFTEDVKVACDSFFGLYGQDVGNHDVVEAFLIKKIKDGDIEPSFSYDLITKEEVCSFVVSNLYTRFIMNGEVCREPSQSEIEQIKKTFSKALFGNNNQDIQEL